MKNELAKRKNNLPENIKDLSKFVLIGREKLIAVKAQIRAIDKMGIATEVREQKKEEAQDLAGALLDAEVRIGELLKNHTSRGGSMDGKRGSEKTLPEGITHKQSHYYQTMAENQDVVEQVKAEAADNDDLPTRTEVLRIVKQKEQEYKFTELKKQSHKSITGKYDVIVIDPPWPMEKIDRDITPEQTGFDYPTMSMDEIADLKLPAKDDCHLFLWITNKLLPEGFEILKRWNFNYICSFVWHKNGGFQPFNLPQYNCEFILYARKGTPKFVDTKNFFTCFSADRKGHSIKPDEFYSTIERVTHGSRIDMFNRRKIKGFEGWGNECQ